MENRTQKFCSISLPFYQRFDHDAAVKIERKMSHLNIAFDRYTSIGTVMHYILEISDQAHFIHIYVHRKKCNHK